MATAPSRRSRLRNGRRFWRLGIPLTVAAAGLAALPTLSAPAATADSFPGEAAVVGTSGRCLDARGGRNANGTQVQLHDCNGSPAQRWRIGPDGTIRAMGRCLDVRNGSRSAGTLVQLHECDGARAQRWRIRDDGSIRVFRGMCLDAKDFGTVNGTELQIWNCHVLTNQQWSITSTIVPSGTPSPGPSTTSPAPSPTESVTPSPPGPSATSPTVNPHPSGPPTPRGPTGTFRLAFESVFDKAIDWSQWGHLSSSQSNTARDGRGTYNPGNEQLELNRPENCAIADGALRMTARRERVVVDGRTFDWTSCLLTSKFAFRYGYLETSARFPGPRGFWPALWTWAAPGATAPGNAETDAFEFYSDNHRNLYLTSHNSGGSQCRYEMPFDPTTGFHTYGVDIQPSGTTWYVDGKDVCRMGATSPVRTNIILDNFVYSKIPPLDGTNDAALHVRYVRVFQR